MSEMFGVIRLLVLCGHRVVAGVCRALGDAEEQTAGSDDAGGRMAMTAFCILYGISPIDLMPRP